VARARGPTRDAEDGGPDRPRATDRRFGNTSDGQPADQRWRQIGGYLHAAWRSAATARDCSRSAAIARLTAPTNRFLDSSQ
jgi:hypothetical protein